MKLWLIAPKDELKGPWNPWYDKCFGMVIRAESPERARVMAAENCCAEGGACWLDSNLSVCSELVAEGDPEVILREERWA